MVSAITNMVYEYDEEIHNKILDDKGIPLVVDILHHYF